MFGRAARAIYSRYFGVGRRCPDAYFGPRCSLFDVCFGRGLQLCAVSSGALELGIALARIPPPFSVFQRTIKTLRATGSAAPCAPNTARRIRIVGLYWESPLGFVFAGLARIRQPAAHQSMHRLQLPQLIRDIKITPAIRPTFQRPQLTLAEMRDVVVKLRVPAAAGIAALVSSS